MDTGFKILNKDLEALYESFPNEIAVTYGVTDSKFTDNGNKFKKEGRPIKEVIEKTIPTSAGANTGGSYKISAYKTEGQPIDVALKGCRPIGIPIARLTPGTHYINRLDSETWLSSLPNSATGIKLEYNPKYLHVELLGGGGGGGGSATFYASAGGGSGGYCYKTISIPENSYLQFVVGEKGFGGNAREKGANGGTSKILNADGFEICSAAGGNGGDINNSDGGWFGSATGGLVNISGAQGGAKENNGSGLSQLTVTLDKPEQTIWIRGGTNGGISNGNNFGGGGGASVFSNGAAGNTNTTPEAAGYGAGGAGAGFKAATASKGGDGGEGLINLYY